MVRVHVTVTVRARARAGVRVRRYTQQIHWQQGWIADNVKNKWTGQKEDTT
jgi:hypothetical protein